MAYTTINKSTAYFNAKPYAGDGNASNAITGVGFQPDLVWLKDRTETSNHQLHDAVRGKSGSNYYYIHSDGTPAQGVQGDNDGLNTLGTDGFTVGYTNSTAWNKSGNNYASWCWKAGGGQGSSNTDGSINTTYTSVNTTAGFSISTYTGTGSAGTIGHGLGSTPKMIIVKCTSDADTWAGYHVDVGATKYMELDTTAAAQTSTQPWNDTEPTSSVFTVGDWSATNGSGRTYVAYCFADVAGYSKFGSYTGNGNADGTFVYTGFKPAWLLVKRAVGGTQDWQLFDSTINPYNDATICLRPNQTNGDQTGNSMDLLSNGFKNNLTGSSVNTNGDTYIYMAFGQSIVGTNDTPATAR